MYLVIFEFNFNFDNLFFMFLGFGIFNPIDLKIKFFIHSKAPLYTNAAAAATAAVWFNNGIAAGWVSINVEGSLLIASGSRAVATARGEAIGIPGFAVGSRMVAVVVVAVVGIGEIFVASNFDGSGIGDGILVAATPVVFSGKDFVGKRPSGSGLMAAFRSAPIGGDAVGVTAGVI
jgi:hypothetical protein